MSDSVYRHYCGHEECDCSYLSSSEATPDMVLCASDKHPSDRKYDGKTVRYDRAEEVDNQ